MVCYEEHKHLQSETSWGGEESVGHFLSYNHGCYSKGVFTTDAY